VLEVIGFPYVSLGSITDQRHDSVGADAHAHVHRLVSVVKMVTALEKCTTEKQHSIARILWGKELNAVRTTQFTTGSKILPYFQCVLHAIPISLALISSLE
jgi:hypothetical protein